MKLTSQADFEKLAADARAAREARGNTLCVCAGTGCVSSGSGAGTH